MSTPLREKSAFANIRLRLIDPHDKTHLVASTFRFTSLGPNAFYVIVRVPQGTPPAWVFNREEFTLGLDDLPRRPDIYSSHNLVALPLLQPSSMALLAAPIRELCHFLRDTYALVPRGREGEFSTPHEVIGRLGAHA